MLLPRRASAVWAIALLMQCMYASALSSDFDDEASWAAVPLHPQLARGMAHVLWMAPFMRFVVASAFSSL